MQVYLMTGISALIIIFLVIKLYNNKRFNHQAELQAKFLFLEQEYQHVVNEKKELQAQLNQEIEAKFIALKKEALALQQCDNLIKQMENWEQYKAQSMDNAKVAIFEVGSKLSKDLIEQHKIESGIHKEETNKQFKQTTENLYKDFSKLAEIISVLKDQVSAAQTSTDSVYRALLSPSTAGGLAEITLENILKSSNLIANIDYQMQYSIEDENNNRLRPDAVIFLPGDNILVIDSKASKFFLELGKAKTSSEEEQIKQKIKTTMRTHLKSLASKDYRQSIANHLKNKLVNHISTIMFLPTETCIEKIQEIDINFISDAWQNNIFPAGPVGLINILANAKFQISEENKNKNYNLILTEVSSLLYNIVNLAEYAKKLGSSLNSSIGFFDKFAASFNTNIIARSKRLEKLGVAVKTNKQVPEKLERYQVLTGSKMTMIEAESAIDEEKDE
jgi:DNA recombination protein RmuC